MKQFFLLFFYCISFSISAQNVNLSNGHVFDGEPFLCIDQNRPQHLCIAWMSYVPGNALRLSIKTRSSEDGGNTWTPTQTIPHRKSTYKSADPSLAYDNQGNVYLCFIDYEENPDSGSVIIYKSMDNGKNWIYLNSVIDVHDDLGKSPIDRPWLHIAPDGKHMAVTSKPAPWISAPNRSYLICSDNAGKTWKPFQYTDTTNYRIGNLIQAPMATATYNSFGLLRYAYPSYVPAQNVYPQFIVCLFDSNDNKQFTPIWQGIAPKNDSAKMGYILLSNPANPAHLAFVFPGNTSSDIDVYFTESRNNGQSWTKPQRVNDDSPDTARMQDLIWASFDTDGDLLITWRDRRHGNSNAYAEPTEIMGAFRPKDSAFFRPNFTLSDISAPFAAILAENGNDFMSVQLLHDTVHAAWANTRDGSLNVWYARLAVNTHTLSGLHVFQEQSDLRCSIFPNPTENTCIIQTKSMEMADIRVVSNQGEHVFERKHVSLPFELNCSHWKAGIYYCLIQTKNGQTVQSIIKK